jgi:molybdate/tungstate transport system substrate-binding protein
VHASERFLVAKLGRQSFTLHRTLFDLSAVMLALGMILATTGVAASASPQKSPKGSVDVIFDSSLTDTMAILSAAFEKSSHISVLQTAGGSAADAAAISGKTTVQDIFVSEGSAAEQALEGSKNGNWVSWYAQFGSTPLVLAYNPKSKFAKDLKTMPWYKVASMPGFTIGRANPKAYSTGTLAVQALDSAAKSEHLPVLAKLATAKNDAYSEADLVSDLQKGHIAAGFFYGVDAAAFGFRTVSLGSIHLGAPYMVTILHNPKHPADAIDFVKFLLKSSTPAVVHNEGVTFRKSPLLSGQKTAVPNDLRSLIT